MATWNIWRRSISCCFPSAPPAFCAVIKVRRGSPWLSADVPLVVQVLDRHGEVVGSLEVPLDVPEPGVVGEFDVEVPYQIPFAQLGRIAVYEPGKDIPGIVHYNSLSLYLWP